MYLFQSRIDKMGGGSAIYVNDDLHPQLLQNPIFSTAEVVCVEIEIKLSKMY